MDVPLFLFGQAIHFIFQSTIYKSECAIFQGGLIICNQNRKQKMKPPIVIVGIGELASVFAKAFLRNGYPVYPITRNMNIAKEAENLPEPQLVLVAVAEKDFQQVMETMPARWRKRLVLLQNELLPRDWLAHAIDDPTVMIEGLVNGIKGDPDHKCKGRSAPGRLARALETADQAGLNRAMVRDIHPGLQKKPIPNPPPADCKYRIMNVESSSG